MSLPVGVKDALEGIMSDDSKGKLQRWNEMRHLLLAKGVCYKTKCQASNFIIHPQNRGNVLMNPVKMHAKGKMIVDAGASLAMLHGATAFECAPDAAIKTAQFEPMLKLASAHELVPNVSGNERYMSVSCSNTTQFIKGIQQSIPTCEASLKSSTGHLGPHLCQGDKELELMVQEGWEWLIIPWIVEKELPSLPNFVQQALNLTNAIHEIQSEMELASSIVAMCGNLGGNVNWDKVAADCCTGGPVAKYSALIGRFVRFYSGQGVWVWYRLMLQTYIHFALQCFF